MYELRTKEDREKRVFVQSIDVITAIPIWDTLGFSEFECIVLSHLVDLTRKREYILDLMISRDYQLRLIIGYCFIAPL